MLLKLVELRSSDWGRVCSAAATSNATPDNDPNYFMVSVRLFISFYSSFSTFIFAFEVKINGCESCVQFNLGRLKCYIREVL